MVDYICHMVLTTWKLIWKDPWISESLENDRWSCGSVYYSFSINWDGSKRLTVVNLTLCHDLCLKHCHPPFLGSFSATCFDSCESIKCHFNAKTFFKFLWLEFRFKSFLELRVHFKGFVCFRMRKLHAEFQIPADAHVWCQTVFSSNVPKLILKYWTTKTVSQFLGWSVRTLAQYSIQIKVLKQEYFKTNMAKTGWMRVQLKKKNVLKTGIKNP